MKKLTAFSLSLCLCVPAVCSFASCSQSSNDGDDQKFGLVTPAMPDSPSEGLEYELNEDGTAYIFNGVGSCVEKNIRIADEYNGLPVVKIAEGAFNMAIETVSVTVGKNIAEIGYDAFSNLTTVQAFFITEGNTAYKITDDSLYTADGSVLIRYAVDSSRTSYTVPETVIEIKEQAFNGCDYLTSVTIPEGVEIIGKGSFYNCNQLTTIHIPASVTSLGTPLIKCGSGAQISEISVAEGNTAYKSVEGVLYTKDGKELLEYPVAKKMELLTVPDGVEIIKSGAFSSCEGLKSIVLPMTVRTIQNSAFAECSGLKSVELTFGIETIEWWAFGNCTELRYVKMVMSLANIGDTAFSGCTKLTQMSYDGTKSVWEMFYNNAEWGKEIPLEKVICTDEEIIYN